ncbi:MAG: hypothetical protein KGN16_07935 [Burkholderiales bacterium]|nr:hypothetical protein [Burkholderiales bacterium]
MNKRRCHRVAGRIHLRLMAELGEGIDTERMVEDPLYARDVLLVCDALRGSDLAQLAVMYRAALRAEPRPEPTAAPLPETAAAESTPPSTWGSIFNSVFGASSTSPAPLDGPAPPPRRRWFGARR